MEWKLLRKDTTDAALSIIRIWRMFVYAHEVMKSGDKSKSYFWSNLERRRERIGYLWWDNVKQKIMSGRILSFTIYDLHQTYITFIWDFFMARWERSKCRKKNGIFFNCEDKMELWYFLGSWWKWKFSGTGLWGGDWEGLGGQQDKRDLREERGVLRAIGTGKDATQEQGDGEKGRLGVKDYINQVCV